MVRRVYKLHNNMDSCTFSNLYTKCATGSGLISICLMHLTNDSSNADGGSAIVEHGAMKEERDAGIE